MIYIDQKLRLCALQYHQAFDERCLCDAVQSGAAHNTNDFLLRYSHEAENDDILI